MLGGPLLIIFSVKHIQTPNYQQEQPKRDHACIKCDHRKYDHLIGRDVSNKQNIPCSYVIQIVNGLLESAIDRKTPVIGLTPAKPYSYCFKN